MTLHLTFAGNTWGEGCMRRLPQCGDCYVHLVNNYLNCAGNSTGMTINENCKALVEGNYAASGVKNPLTGSGSNRSVTARNNSFSASSVGSTVTVPYEYAIMDVNNVPATLRGEEGAGAKLGNDADYILSTIPTGERIGGGASVYVMMKEDAHIGGKITEISGLTVTFDPSVTDWKSGGSSSGAQTVDGVDISGYYTQSNGVNGAPIIIETTQADTLTIFLGGGVATNKSVNMTEGENGLTATVLSSGATIENGAKPETEIAQWDALVYTLEANKTYKFFIGGTKWRLAAIRYVIGATGISAVRNAQSAGGAVYNLQGVRVSNPSKGIYIQNGKKTMMK